MQASSRFPLDNPAYKLQGKVAIVTGSSRGIGAAVAKRLAACGANVIINYSAAASSEQAAQVQKEIESAGGKAVVVRADVGDPTAMRELFNVAKTSFGGIDLVVCNAAIFDSRPVGEVSEELFDRLLRLNVRGLFFLCQEAAKQLRDGGRIVNLSSPSTKRVVANVSHYAGTRAFGEAMVRSLAAELAPRAITVNTVTPGHTITEQLGPLDGHHAKVGIELSPFKRLGTAEEVAEVIVFLCSDSARWVTGQNIQAGGGITMQ